MAYLKRLAQKDFNSYHRMNFEIEKNRNDQLFIKVNKYIKAKNL